MTDQPRAFVLMPFDPEFTSIYEQLVRPSLEDCGYEVTRADSFLDQQNILKDIVRGIASADLVVADLTALNANVLYELGICHGLNKPTILLTQSIDEVPFDLRGYRMQLYDTRFDQAHQLIESLREIGSEHLADRIAFGNPVSDFYPQVTEMEGPMSVQVPQPPAGLDPEAVEKGVVDFLYEGDEASKTFVALLGEISEDTKAVGERMGNHTDNINALSENPGPGAASMMAKISSLVAADMASSAFKVEDALPELDASIDSLEESYIGYLNWFSPKSEEHIEQLRGFRGSVEGLLNVTGESLPQISGYRDAVLGLKGISAEINRSSRRLSTALDGLISLTQKTTGFAARTLSLIDEKISRYLQDQDN